MTQIKKLNYDLKIYRLISQYTAYLKTQGLEADTRYIDYYGDTCPRCKSKLRIYNNTVKDASSVSMFLILEQKKGLIYCLCRECAKEVSSSVITKASEEKMELTEEYIYTKLPDLKETEKDTFNEELSILTRLHENL